MEEGNAQAMFFCRKSRSDGDSVKTDTPAIVIPTPREQGGDDTSLGFYTVSMLSARAAGSK